MRMEPELEYERVFDASSGIDARTFAFPDAGWDPSGLTWGH